MWQGDWKGIPVFMMDFEGSTGSGVVEFGVVRLEGGAIREVVTEPCRPVGTISVRDRDVHGLTEEALSERTPFRDYYRQFTGFRREGIFAAHNRHAENSFIKETWPVPPKVPDWRGEVSGHVHEWGPWIDTLSIYRALYGGLASYGLQELVQAFNLEDPLTGLADAYCPERRRKPHCALYDALASALLLLRLEDEADLQGRISTAWLLRLSRQVSGQQELF